MKRPAHNLLPVGYTDWLEQLKRDITHARQRAALAVNAELIALYHRIGTEIQHRQHEQGWGAKVIDRLAQDLKHEFPDMRGFSTRNLKYMAFFAQHCLQGQFGQQAAAQIGLVTRHPAEGSVSTHGMPEASDLIGILETRTLIGDTTL